MIEEEFSYSEWAKRPAIANRSGAGDVSVAPVRIKTRRSMTRFARRYRLWRLPLGEDSLSASLSAKNADYSDDRVLANAALSAFSVRKHC